MRRSARAPWRHVLGLGVLLALPTLLSAAPAETITIANTVTGPTANLCVAGSPSAPTETGLFVQVLDQAIFYTLHSPTATPSAVVGGYAPANTTLVLDRASDFRAIRATGTSARAYLVCVRR